MNTPRTLIIGLDGATFDLIKPLANAGYLPTLSKLMAHGVHGPLRAWPNTNSAAAWSSIVTGYNPGQHGIYNFGDTPPQRGTSWHPTTAADRKKDPFWRLLSASGQYVGIINVPISYPVDLVNGFMLAGMDTPGVRSSGFAHPPELLDELQREGIDYVIDVPNLGVLSRQNPHQLPESVKRMIDARSRTVLHLMKTRPWNVLMAVFVAPDRVQHYYWPDEQAPIESMDWAPIRSLYQQIDSFLNQALELIDENTTVLLVSDHGFGRIKLAKHCLNQLFAQLGLLHYCKGKSRLQGKLLERLLLYGRRIIPHRFQYPLSRSLPRLRLRAVSEHMYSGIEWSQTKVFAHPRGRRVYINLQGREPEGIVSAKESHSLCERVRDIFLKLTDPESGVPVVRGVYRPEDLYHGPYAKETADLLIEWNEEAFRDSLCYHGEGKPITIQVPKRMGDSFQWRGSHRSQGIFMACGPHIKQGATVANATLYNITPTILYLQGHPIPKDMDGKVLTDIFIDDHLSHHPIQQSEPSDIKWEGTAAALDAEEIRKIKERLRGLGYIE